MAKQPLNAVEDWCRALVLLVEYERGTGHLDQLLEVYPLGSAQGLARECFRQWLVVDGLLAERLRKRPRPKVRHLLRLALTELIAGESAAAQVVHHAVEAGRHAGLSKPELGLVNAVLRAQLRSGLPQPGPELDRINHPAWLVERWEAAFGEPGLGQLLRWNQSTSEYFVVADSLPFGCQLTNWEGIYRVEPGGLERLMEGLGDGSYTLMDPFARIPVEMLDPQPGECILDLCAAPGGKSRLIAKRMSGSGHLIAVEKPGPRVERLRENLRPWQSIAQVKEVAVEALEAALATGEPVLRPGQADGVLLDVPCSNTGVLRRRPDVRLRLQPQSIAEVAAQQARLLGAAAIWVRPGGRLVYSTCSIEPEENDRQVAAFLQAHPQWQLEAQQLSLPWLTGHDGGGAYLLRRGS